MNLEKTIHEPRIQLVEYQQKVHEEGANFTQSLRAQEGSSSMSLRIDAYFLYSGLLDSRIACLENTVQELLDKLAASQRTASEQKDSLNGAIRSLRADLHTQESSSSAFIVTLDRSPLIYIFWLTSVRPKDCDC